MFRFFAAGIVAVLTLCPILTFADQIVVDVFYKSTVDARPNNAVPGVIVHLWDLDEPEKIKAQKPSIVGTESDVRRQVESWASSEEGKAYFQRMLGSFEGHQRAFSLRVEKIPAIVINESYVVYGSTNVRRALTQFSGIQE